MDDSKSLHRSDGRRIETEFRTTATPEEVWKAWTDPASISRWFTDDARGEAKPGDTLVWVFRGFGEIPYPVAVAEPPGRLVLAGEMPGRGPFALEILIRRTGGTTTVRLVNSGFLDGADFDEEYEGVRSGWDASLALLKHYLERHLGQSRRAALIVRPAAVGARELYRCFSEADGLAAWLTREGALGGLGGPRRWCCGTVRDSRVASSRPPGGKAVTWDEEDGAVLELKGFAAGEATWRGPPHHVGLGCRPALPAGQLLTPAVERLATTFSG
jgi:uncharacterized protein YndB with AHSA1/START domain